MVYVLGMDLTINDGGDQRRQGGRLCGVLRGAWNTGTLCKREPAKSISMSVEVK